MSGRDGGLPPVFPLDFPAASPPAPSYASAPDAIPPWFVQSAGLRARFARSQRDLEAIQRLRYRVFNLELGEGLASARLRILRGEYAIEAKSLDPSGRSSVPAVSGIPRSWDAS